MESIKTRQNVIIEYPKGCGNAPRKFFIVEALAAAIEQDEEFLAHAFAENLHLPDIPEDIEKITMNSVITHGKDAAVECRIFYMERAPVEAGVFVTFKSAGKNVINRINVFVKEADA